MFHHLDRFVNLLSPKRDSASDLKLLRDNTTKILRSISNLGRADSLGDDLCVYLTVRKLDSGLRKEWEKSLGNTTAPPSFDQLMKFIDINIRALETSHATNPSPQPASHSTNSGKSRSTGPRAYFSKTTFRSCPDCNELHYIGQCAQFRQRSSQQRKDLASKWNLCTNCLSKGHSFQHCKSERRCGFCNQSHHSLLHQGETSATKTVHFATRAEPSTSSGSHQVSTEVPETSTIQSNHAAQLDSSAAAATLLATALVTLTSPEGRFITVRALLDQGSEASFVSEGIAQQLKLKRTRVNLSIIGLGAARAGIAKSLVQVSLQPATAPEPCLLVRALVLPKLTNSSPSTLVAGSHWQHLKGLSLADPPTSRTRPIDLILGADIYGSLLVDGMRKGPPGTPFAQNTILGWVLFGPISNQHSDDSMFCNDSHVVTTLHTSINDETNRLLKRFWELEEVDTPLRMQTQDEIACEQHYVSTHRRNEEGRYIVRLPFKVNPQQQLGNSKNIALRVLFCTERRFITASKLQQDYSDFLDDYLHLGHMEPVSQNSIPNDSASTYYLPHHAVFRADSLTTKVRVVFNASQVISSGKSLNDCLYTGSILQSELHAVLSKWRTHRIAFMADIEKMYRQILIHPDDADYQRILWRNSAADTVQEYRLLTVTYGTSAAPYLAIRTLHQLAEDECERYPIGASVLKNDFYVDDLVSGADNLEAACIIQDQLNDILLTGGFTLRKWVANCSQLIDRIPSHLQQQALRHLSENDQVSALGLLWNPTTDQFQFKMRISPLSVPLTKRKILSTIAQLFDPLGWLAPVVVQAKILLQQLWLACVDWDSALPGHIENQWTKYYQELPGIESLTLNRWVGTHKNQSFAEFHGFSDASLHAYAAVVFLRIVDGTGNITTSLVAAKSKVSPLKVVSIPRLELCGVILLARLLRAVSQHMKLQHLPMHAWTDSRVVLAWLASHPNRWTCFVANRVVDLQTLLPDLIWHHVSTTDNPADCASRGLTLRELRNHHLWWHGPPWLSQQSHCWPHSTTSSDVHDVPEIRKSVSAHVVQTNAWDLEVKYSNLMKLFRITALCQRFIRNLHVPPAQRKTRFLTTGEIGAVQTFWIRKVQAVAFSTEISLLNANKPLPRRSPLISFTPFFDQKGILRIGGRLCNAFLSFEEKHPAILPNRAPLSLLWVDYAHILTLHGGTQLTLSQLLRKVWIIGARSLVRSRIRQCVRCCRFKAQFGRQQMGDLPESRLVPARPFSRTGLDYAGPIKLRTTKGRGHRSCQGYIALFICLVTKAIHLEVVSDYSTSTFLAAFKRFTARRGLCTEMLSDNGTNFKGADSQLRAMFRDSSRYWGELASTVASSGTNWSFIPPASPHFGGLWEAGVKSVKYHLKRIIGDHTLTFEEMSTVLAQIEACLNSRPISPISSDPQDWTALTPGHFLIGSALTTVPEPGTPHLPSNHLSRWQLVQNMQEHFWKRWSKEYLHNLQQKYKWRMSTANLRPGTLVVLKDERLPPTKWALARITEVHPGHDGLVRVVTVRTATATLKRPITKLCPLPIETPDSNQNSSNTIAESNSQSR